MRLQTWITFPALIYNAIFPLWERTRRFLNPYATTAIDVVYTIFWVGAFASVQVWTSSGVLASSQGFCSSFAYGDQDKCVMSYGTVAIGVLMFICWMFAAGISIYNLIQFRLHGLSRPSISNPKPIEPKFVYPDNASSRYSGNSRAPATRIHDLEKGSMHTQTDEGTHPGRKLSWGQSPPNTAPPQAGNFPEARPVFRTIDYNKDATETSPLSAAPPGAAQQQRRNAQSARYTPPRLQLYGPQDRSPALIMDYGAMRTPLTPNVNAAPYNMRGGRLMRAPSTAYASMYGGDFLNGQRSHYSGNNGNNGRESVTPRRPISRMPLPGPASYRMGGYSSGFNTPLPTAMLTPAQGNSWRRDVEQSYQQQLGGQAWQAKGVYAQ